jgi:TRAP-type C4-dicarboxylate transport system permease small subunit
VGIDTPVPSDPSHFLPPPDDSPLSAKIRALDEGIGLSERTLLFAAFIILVLTGLYRTAVDMLWGDRPLWAIEIVRVAAFSIGMLGAAYAAQSRRNFGLDLVSAFMSHRTKAVARVFTNLAALCAAGLLFHGGRLIQEALTKEKQHFEVVPIWVIGGFIPVCAVLIMVHVLLHLIIEIDFLRRGKTAPEPELVG